MRGRDFREVVRTLTALPGVRGGLFVAPDGLVIAAELPAAVPVEALSALAATLGRELEVGGARTVRGRFRIAELTGTEGRVFLGATPVGFLVLLADADVDEAAVTRALREAVEAVRQAWPATPAASR